MFVSRHGGWHLESDSTAAFVVGRVRCERVRVSDRERDRFCVARANRVSVSCDRTLMTTTRCSLLRSTIGGATHALDHGGT